MNLEFIMSIEEKCHHFRKYDIKEHVIPTLKHQ